MNETVLEHSTLTLAHSATSVRVLAASHVPLRLRAWTPRFTSLCWLLSGIYTLG